MGRKNGHFKASYNKSLFLKISSVNEDSKKNFLMHMNILLEKITLSYKTNTVLMQVPKH